MLNVRFLGLLRLNRSLGLLFEGLLWTWDSTIF